MVKFNSFEEIEAWKESRLLIKKIREICKREDVRRDFGFVDQITRASRSMAANIAEGNDAMNMLEFITFLGYAKRSAAEVRSHLYDALDEEYVSQEEFRDLSAQATKIARMISNLASYLQTCDLKQKRISSPLKENP